MASAQSIEIQIMEYVNHLSDIQKEKVLKSVKIIAEEQYAADFEKKWAEGIPLAQAKQELLDHVRRFEWKKKK
jgi:hypothetical protein